MKNEERIFLFLLLAVALFMTATSLGFSSSSRMLPLISGSFAAISLAFLITASYAPKLAAWYRRMENKAELKAVPLSGEERKKELVVTAWFIGAFLLVYLLGFMVAIPLFLFLFLKLRARESWMLSLVIPVIVTVVIYFSFISILRVRLYSGLFF